MSTLTIFANFYINDYERFLRVKDSFKSFKDINAERWVINVRGKYKLAVLFFLYKHLGDKLIPYLLESGKGWFYDSRQMVHEIDTDFVLFWIEDHINLADVKKYDEILNEMEKSQTEYLRHSWWWNGMLEGLYDGIEKEEYGNIRSFLMSKEGQKKVCRKYPLCIIDCLGIFKTDFFKKIINKNDPVLRRWPKETPFDFEKKPWDFHWLPFKYALPKYELFASVDDDHICPGSSLQSRGLYPIREIRKEAKAKLKSKWKEFLKNIVKKIYLEKSFIFLRRFLYHL